jgi:hypothetical protein
MGVDRSGNQFFSRARLTLNQDGAVRRRHQVHVFENGLKLCALAKHFPLN